MSVQERCPSDRESNKGSKERQGPTLRVRLTKMSVSLRCSLIESRLYYSVTNISEYQRGNFNFALYFLQGNYAKARFHYETAAKLNPNDNTLKQNLAKLQRLEKRSHE